MSCAFPRNYTSRPSPSTHRRRREEVKRLLVFAGELSCSTGGAHKPARKEQAQARPLNSDAKVILAETQHLKGLPKKNRRSGGMIRISGDSARNGALPWLSTVGRARSCYLVYFAVLAADTSQSDKKRRDLFRAGAEGDKARSHLHTQRRREMRVRGCSDLFCKTGRKTATGEQQKQRTSRASSTFPWWL